MVARKDKNVVIYQSKSGAIELRGDFGKETIWATQAQIVKLFDVDQSVVSRHIRNLFKDGEIEGKSNMQKMHNANSDKPVFLYSLDVVLGVGYRTNSKVAVEFRRWATRTLRGYIIDGYAVNKRRIAKNYAHFMSVVDDIKKIENAIIDKNVRIGNDGVIRNLKKLEEADGENYFIREGIVIIPRGARVPDGTEI